MPNNGTQCSLCGHKVKQQASKKRKHPSQLTVNTIMTTLSHPTTIPGASTTTEGIVNNRNNAVMCETVDSLDGVHPADHNHKACPGNDRFLRFLDAYFERHSIDPADLVAVRSISPTVVYRCRCAGMRFLGRTRGDPTWRELSTLLAAAGSSKQLCSGPLRSSART